MCASQSCVCVCVYTCVNILMDPIKIIVTNSDATSISPANSHYQLATNEFGTNEAKSFDDLAHNARNNNVTISKSANRWNLPPLKLSTSEQNTFSVHKNMDNDHNDVFESKKPLLSPLLGKSYLSSQSTTSLNCGKKVKILPSSSSSRIPTTVAGEKNT